MIGNYLANALSMNKHTVTSLRYDESRHISITLPERLNFQEDYDNTCSHFTILRNAVENGLRIKRLDFSKISSISTSAALVLASTVDQWKERVRGKLKADLPSWQADITRLLCQMGYFELLGLKKPPIKWPVGEITFLPLMRGKVGGEDSGAMAKQLRLNIENIVGGSIKKHFLFEGLSEAITNVSQHAYTNVIDDKRKYWWLSASFNSVTRELCVTFYDKGAGIPKTLPAHKLFEKIKLVFDAWSDSKKIEAAMEIGRTSSGMEERGKGLQNLIEFAKAHEIGKVRVSSLRGCFEEAYETGQSGKQEMGRTRTDYKHSVGGTLIEWSVILNC